MSVSNNLPRIAMGAWAWGNDGTFGSPLAADTLRPVFDAAMNTGLNCGIPLMSTVWDSPRKHWGNFLRNCQERVI